VSATAKRLLGATGGNPFFVGELVAHLAEEDSDPARSEPSSFPFPASVQDVLGRRIRRLSPRSIRALTTAAIIGRDFPFALLETVSAPGDVSGLLDDLEAGVRGGLIRDLPGARYTFAHDLVRESLYRDTLEARRLKTHASIAEALETNPPAQWQLEAIAHHYAAAVPLAPVAKAIDFALLAGQAAKQQLAYADAAAHYERGLALLEDAGDVDRDRRAELLLGLAESQLGRGELATYKATAALAATDARRGGSATLLARAAILYASILNVGTDDPLMISMPEEALVALGDSEPQLASLVLSHLASVQAMGLADRKTGGELALRALALARECEDPIALGTALHAHATCMVGAPDIAARLVVLDEAERVWVELGAPLRVSGAGWGVDPRLRAGAYLELGEMERFEQTVDLLETLGAERGDWFAVAFAKSMRRIGLMIYGRFAEAEALLPEMLEAGGQHPDIPLQYAAQLMWSMREQGRVPELLPLMRTAVEQNLENHAFRSGFVMVLADLGEKTEAVAELERLSVGVFPAMPRNFTWKLCLAMLAEACCLLDDKDRCAVLLEHLSPYSGQLVATGWGTVCIGSVDRYLGMLSAALGNLDGAEQSYRAALSLEDQIGAEPFAARTCLWLARLLSMRAGPGDEEEADGLVERGVGLAERLGMAALSSAAAAG
jgi:tetratricopeptide (TPR) repeat protein